MKIKNYNYVFVMYDVDAKRCQKVFKICKKYLSHYQNSIFRGEITPSRLMSLKRELKKVIEVSYDYVSIIKMINKHNFDEEQIGNRIPKTDEIIL